MWNINFSKQIRLSFISFTRNIENSRGKWRQKQQITPWNFEFYCKEILLKDEFIRYLIETQTTVLDVVTSVKNQEKTHEKIQKTNVPQQRQQQNLQRQHIQQHFLCEHNIWQDQPQLKPEIFQSNFRPKNAILRRN